MARFEFDTSKLKSKVAALQRAATRGTRILAAEMCHLYADVMEEVSPMDTNRYVRAWEQAANQAAQSAGSDKRRILHRINESSRFDQYVTAFEARIGFFEEQIGWREKRVAVWYTKKGRPIKGWAKREQRKIGTLEKRLARQKEELAKLLTDRSALVFDAINPGKKRPVATVRLKIYGGTGVVKTTAGFTYFVLTNKEPHAKIVESRFGPKRKAVRGLSKVGLKALARDLFNERAGEKAVSKV